MIQTRHTSFRGRRMTALSLGAYYLALFGNSFGGLIRVASAHTTPVGVETRRGTTATTRQSCCGFAIQFRSATPDDVAFARKTMLSEFMNPLSIAQETLVVAFDGDSSSSSRGDEAVLGFGQIRPMSLPSSSQTATTVTNTGYDELASLYVIPEQRTRGVGRALVQELLSRHDHDDDHKNHAVCLLTLKTTVPFYEPVQFHVVSQSDMGRLSISFRFEYTAGSILSTVLGNELTCMIRQPLPSTNE
uniref:N-acetyltransferase domain-containing protein n=1 Tax=Attheya septentrionalis TaxID=420275 RepID=A0A7S2XUZ5_9STRA|mmetsp:Transcript_4254/g.7630  ORF Transcript_4254/g.7630 Transcript_4254/m.7630 type:complete len:246 (+) Transcript_4254:109-846(+)|eukprot:CAMPEP_0198296598 /NCGR_PEP_ID=MMETSP1449-20131203/33248_1 /TAXON_ID=420275 /ORGANISM="Attheya septentrionalis, Strain CCMP2084" /LENGTH=245 /DNA_ID=CAMNT_0043997263 /DNA_START=138 /DNA_END=875 /DNA_ORIENTATION=+